MDSFLPKLLRGLLRSIAALTLTFLMNSGVEAQEGALTGEAESESSALTFEFSLIVDMLSNLSGGVQRGSDLLGSLLLSLELDGEKAFGWKGSRFLATGFGAYGGPFTSKVGDFQTVSNVEAPNTVGLLEAYYEQSFLSDRLSILGGLYLVDTEFDTRESGDIFVHSAPGTGSDIGQLGVNGPGIYPVGSLGVRVKYEDRGWFGQVAVVEGVPGDPDNPQRTTLKFDFDEGLFVIGEIGHVWSDEIGQLGKVGLGAWGFTQGYETHSDPDRQASNEGVYLSLEKTFFREGQDGSQGLAGYLRTGIAEGAVNPIGTFVSGGLVYTGPFKGRDQDKLGVSINTGFASAEFLNSGDFDNHETTVELTYAVSITEAFSLQPEFQYVINPGFDPGLDNAVVLGLRAVVAFSL